MRKTGLLVITAVCAVMLAACGGTVENKPANVANTAKPAPAAPTAEMFLDMEKKANEAYTKGDTAHFQTLLSDKAVMAMGKDRMGKADTVKMIGTAKCEGAEIKLSDPQMVKIDNDTYAFAYKNDSTGKCNEGPNGSMVEMKPSRDATIWVRSGDKWQAAWHSSTLIVDPKGTAPAGDKKDDKADVKKEEPKKAEPKKDDSAAAVDSAPAAKKDDAKSAAPESKKDDAKKDEKAAAPADTKPAALTPSANTEALTKAHNQGWEAWAKKDAKFFDTMLTSSFAFIDPMGGWHAGKAEAIKIWTETMKCEGVTKTNFADTFAFAVSPTIEILMGKGSADGTCDGMKNADLWQTAAYVKEGDAWKLAFMLEQPAGK